MAKILIGTAGWSYEDWRGRVYPADAGARFDGLAYVARFFDLVEVNSTFYRLPDPGVAESWLKRTAERPGFQFLLKAPRDWTHTDAPPSPLSVERFTALAARLADAGRLGALLVQFPWSFRNSAPNRQRVADLIGLLAPLPAAVEVRHGGFDRPEWFEFLRSQGCLPVNVDQPVIGRSLNLGAEAGRDRAYFRFHGRNNDAWFDREAGRDARYDFLYGEAELEELGARIDQAAEKVALIFIVTNNHFRGQAAVNALQLMFRFRRQPLSVPPDLVRHFPALKKIALPDDSEQGDLFD